MPHRPALVLFIAFTIAVSGGALGAMTMWLLASRITWSAPGVTAAGWFVTLVGWFISARLSERAQRRMLLHNLLNTARKEIVQEIRLGQDWISRLNSMAFKCQLAVERQKIMPIADYLQRQLFWHDQAAAAHQELYSERGASSQLVMALEEYELLFPETRQVRSQLSVYAQDKVLKPFSDCIIDLGNEPKRQDAITRMQQHSDVRSSYIAVLEDLRTHIQNASLAEIAGSRVPDRKPLDPDLPITRMNTDQQLDIVEAGVSWPVRTWPPTEPTGPSEPDLAPNEGTVHGQPRPDRGTKLGTAD